MQVIFGLGLDGLKPVISESTSGTAILGPKGLLQTIELHLGLPTPTGHPSELLFAYLQCLRNETSPARFFHQSLNVDPVSVARTLLSWREQWYEAGWDGTFPEDVPVRLADMAAVEKEAKHRVPPTRGQRLQRLAGALKSRHTQIERLVLRTPFEDLPETWQRVISQLPWEPATGVQPAAQGSPGSDLRILQERLLTVSDREEQETAERTILKDDGSVVFVKASSKDLSADAISEHLLASERISETLLLAEHDGIILDNALERAGLPRCGFQRLTPFRAATQVLKLSLALVWEPVDPHRLLQFLLHPTGPLPKWVRSRLADAVSESPGIGGPKWIEAINHIGQIQRERDNAEEVEQLRAEIAFWLEGDRYNPTEGAPLEGLLLRTQRVSDWASSRLHAEENVAVATLFAAAHAQAEALRAELSNLRKNGAERILQLALERHIDEVMADAPDPATFEEAGHARATTIPGAINDPWPIVIWWNLAPSGPPVLYPWSQRELDVLRESGVHLPRTRDIVRRQGREWLKPLCSAQERLILVVHDDERGNHPLWTRIESLFTGMKPVRIERSLLEGEDKIEPLAVRTSTLPLRALLAPRRWWQLPDDCTIEPREVESYSSISKLCDYPHEWVLRYAARLRAGRAENVIDGTRLYGILAHRLFEEFFLDREDWLQMQDDEVLDWVRGLLPGFVEREGAVLLEHGRGVDHQRVSASIERALLLLLAHLRASGTVRVRAEMAATVPFAGRQLTGEIDLLLTNNNGNHTVLDVKWASQIYRSKLLEENRTLQLAIYSFLQKSLEGNQVWPTGAYFVLSTGNVLASEASVFPDAIIYPPPDGEDLAALWARLEVTYAWRRTQLERGRIEVPTDATEPDEESRPPEGGLQLLDDGDRFDDFVHLTGWGDAS